MKTVKILKKLVRLGETEDPRIPVLLRTHRTRRSGGRGRVKGVSVLDVNK